MQYAPLGPSGISASRVALGTWAIGGWMWGGQDESESVRAIHAAIDAGITLIDTAPMYGMGESERVVGKAIRDRRDQVVIATKCSMRWDLKEPKGKLFFRTNDESIDEAGEYPVHIYSGPESVREEVERSLGRLGVDTIDLLQTHWQDETTPIADTMAELLRLRDEGKIRAIGACNASVEQLGAYRAAGALDSDQERYSMLDRQLEETQLPWCREQGVAVLAYSPMANGLLTGRMGPDRVFPADDLRSQRPRFAVENRRRVAALLESIRPIAEAHDIGLAQLAVAWALHQPGLTHALVGARTPAQAMENAAAADVELSDAEVKQINATVDKHAGDLGRAGLPSGK